MAEREYTPNSHKFKEDQKEKKKIEKVISGNAKRKKKSELSKISEVFVSSDAKTVSDHVFLDVLVPAIKNALADIVTDGINMILFGDTRGGSNKRGQSNYITYNNKYTNARDRETRRTSGYDFDDIFFDSRGEAEEVLDRLIELIGIYGIASVADFYDLAGSPCNYTDNKYGWTSLKSADVIRTRDGYGLKLPKAMPIE